MQPATAFREIDPDRLKSVQRVSETEASLLGATIAFTKGENEHYAKLDLQRLDAIADKIVDFVRDLEPAISELDMAREDIFRSPTTQQRRLVVDTVDLAVGIAFRLDPELTVKATNVLVEAVRLRMGAHYS